MAALAPVLAVILAVASVAVAADSTAPDDALSPAAAVQVVESRNVLLAELERLDELLDRDAVRVKHDLGVLYSDWQSVRALQAARPLTEDEAALTRAIDSHPDDGDLRGIRGLIRQKQYRLEAALEDLVQAQILSVTDMDLRQAVQKARVELERFKIVMEQGGNDAASEFLYYDIADKFQRYERARDWPRLDAFLADLRDRPGAKPFATVQLAYLRLALGDTDSAAVLLAEARQEQPDSHSRADIDRAEELAAHRAASADPAVGDGAVPPDGPLATIESDPLSMYAMPVAPWLHPSAKIRLAESLMGKRAFPALRVVLGQLDRMNLNDRERGRYLICLGESEWADGREDQAMALFQEAEALPVRDTRRGHIFFRYARYHARKGDRALALDYGQKSLDLTRHYDWAFIRIGALFIELEEYERGLEALQHAFDMANTAEDRCRAASAIADGYKAMGDLDSYHDWAGRFINYAGDIPPPVPDRYLGLDYYYQAELARHDGDAASAFTLYEKAADHLTDAYRRAEVLFFLAEGDAAEGRVDQAVDRAVRSAAALPGQRWKQRQVGTFLIGLGRIEAGADYLERAASVSTDTRDKLAILRDLADRFKRLGNDDRYLRYAEQYADAVDAAADIEPSPEELGQAALYRGDVLVSLDDPAAALAAYEDAARFLTSPTVLADVYMSMAECAARLDEGARAILYGRMAVDTAPASGERRRRVSELIARFTPEESPVIEVLRPEQAGGALSETAAMAEEALAAGDEDHYLEFARKYVDEAGAIADRLSPGQAGLVEFFRAELLHK
ncbi:MAG: hypothetical protein LIQ31_03170, partial [Planctomycetes bacterium]|nr:hypothetical protein [Planctomycetota bacterium]